MPHMWCELSHLGYVKFMLLRYMTRTKHLKLVILLSGDPMLANRAVPGV